MASTLSQADNTICVWNATTGEIEAGPFSYSMESSRSVACSPDGQHIALGLKDQTICVWNTTTGEKREGAFAGHTKPVVCLAFSPDSQHIASGSHDHTVCVWNLTTGEMKAGPFTGHKIQSALWHSHQMVSVSSQVQMIKQFVYGMPLQEG